MIIALRLRAPLLPLRAADACGFSLAADADSVTRERRHYGFAYMMLSLLRDVRQRYADITRYDISPCLRHNSHYECIYTITTR